MGRNDTSHPFVIKRWLDMKNISTSIYRYFLHVRKTSIVSMYKIIGQHVGLMWVGAE